MVRYFSYCANGFNDAKNTALYFKELVIVKWKNIGGLIAKCRVDEKLEEFHKTILIVHPALIQDLFKQVK